MENSTCRPPLTGFVVYSAFKFRNRGRTFRESIFAVNSSAMQPQTQTIQSLEILKIIVIVFL